MPVDYPCLATHPPILQSTAHTYSGLALASRNLGCCVALVRLSLPPPTSVNGPPSALGFATRPLGHRSARAEASSPDSDCLVLPSFPNSSNALSVTTSPAVAGLASRDAWPSKYRSTHRILLCIDCSLNSPHPGIGTYLPPPLGASKRRAYLTVPSREGWCAALAATLATILSACWRRGYSTSMAGSSAAARIEDPSKERWERHSPSDPRNRESSESRYALNYSRHHMLWYSSFPLQVHMDTHSCSIPSARR